MVQMTLLITCVVATCTLLFICLTESLCPQINEAIVIITTRNDGQVFWSKLQKQDPGCKKWNFPWSKMTSLSKNVVSLSVFKLPLTEYCRNTHYRCEAVFNSCFPLTLTSHRGEAGCGRLIFMDQRLSKFVWTDKRGVDRDMCFSPSRGCVYLK